jgi:hypothetical protein
VRSGTETTAASPAARARPDCENEPRQITAAETRPVGHRPSGKKDATRAGALGFERRFDRDARVVDRDATRGSIAFPDETSIETRAHRKN